MSDRPYHHGDLKSALVDAALAAVVAGGPEAVSLRELAAALGVSRAAPYRHFADRDALLAAVAARGFEELNAAYAAVLAGPDKGPAKLRRATRTFLDFAGRRPGLHRLMFESDFLSRRPPPAVLLPPAQRAWTLLWDLVREADPTADDKTVKARTLTMVATTHGYLGLRGAGRLQPFMIEPMTDDEVEAAVIAAAVGAG